MKVTYGALVCLVSMMLNGTAFALDEPVINPTAPVVSGDILSDEGTSETVLSDIVLNETEGFSDTTEDRVEVMLLSQTYDSIETAKQELSERLASIRASSIEDVISEESGAVFDTVLQNAEAALNDPDSSLQQIMDQIEELQSALESVEYISEKAILTNNAFSAEDTAKYYPNLPCVETSAFYTYESDSAFVELDGESKKLTNGLEDVANGYMYIANTPESEETVITYDMGEEYYIIGADVFSRFYYYGANSKLRRNIGGFEVELSRDGISFSKIGEAVSKTVPEDKEKNEGIQTTLTFAANPARFVRITVKGDVDSAQYNLNEIVIKGFPSPFSRDELFGTLTACNRVDKDLYTDESYERYMNAYHAAEAVYWDENVSARAIFDAKKALKEAFSQLESKAETKILSGNVESNFTKNYYNQYRMDTLPLTYSYQSGSNEQIVSQDRKCTKLLQGECDALDNSSVAFGTWDGPSAKILFDMGEECYVAGVDVWECYDKPGSQRIGKVTVSVSGDGKNFTKVGEMQNSKDDNATKSANVIGQDFTAVKCRYLLVVVDKSSHQIVLNEVVIKGYRTANQEKNPFRFGILDYKDSNENRIATLNGGDVTVSGEVKSNVASSKDIIVITAAYDANHDIIDFDFSTVTVDAYSAVSFQNQLNLGYHADAEIYTFAWNSFEDGVSLSASKRFGEF